MIVINWPFYTYFPECNAKVHLFSQVEYTDIEYTKADRSGLARARQKHTHASSLCFTIRDFTKK